MVAGGDGTINEALDGMARSGVPLGILPAGTANVLATEMRIGRDPAEAARKLSQWTPRPVATGELRQGACRSARWR